MQLLRIVVLRWSLRSTGPGEVCTAVTMMGVLPKLLALGVNHQDITSSMLRVLVTALNWSK